MPLEQVIHSLNGRRLVYPVLGLSKLGKSVHYHMAEDLPNYFKTCRKLYGLTQREMAQLLGYSGGEQVSSNELARIIADHEEINFHIGSPDGLPEAVRNDCDFIMSLSKMTFTGELSQLLLMEQIYRAITIINSHPYHR